MVFSVGSDSLIIRDVLHGYVFLDKFDRALLDCPIVQRLRYIRHNDVAFLVYPSLNTTRLEHSLGVMHIAGKLAENALANAVDSIKQEFLGAFGNHIKPGETDLDKIGKWFVRSARWYGLLHDVGHLPFSHLSENALHGTVYTEEEAGATGFTKPHELAGSVIVNTDQGIQCCFNNEPEVGKILQILLSSKRLPSDHSNLLSPLKLLVDSPVDADRIDSLARDGLLSGGDCGNYDVERLIRCAILAKDGERWGIFFSSKAISTIESLLFERLKTYRWIHNHHKVQALKAAYTSCISELLETQKPTLKPESWHCSQYVSETGFFDDGTIIKEISALAPKDGTKAYFAKKALIFREGTAWSLWKRREEFEQIANEVFEFWPKKKQIKQPEDGDQFLYTPILNSISPWLTPQLEDILNESPPNGVFFYTFKNSFEPIKHDEEEFKLAEDSSGKLSEIRNYSFFFSELNKINSAEIGFSIIVLGANRDAPLTKKLKAHFVSCVQMLFNRLSESEIEMLNSKFVSEKEAKDKKKSKGK